jgi:hypothetical protein
MPVIDSQTGQILSIEGAFFTVYFPSINLTRYVLNALQPQLVKESMHTLRAMFVEDLRTIIRSPHTRFPTTIITHLAPPDEDFLKVAENCVILSRHRDMCKPYTYVKQTDVKQTNKQKCT